MAREECKTYGRSKFCMDKDNRISRPDEEDEDEDEDDDDDAVQKARPWDDWRDDNPRGAGNKKLTPWG
ncbi:PP2A regulatory subunit TAP46 [Tripterygium wilfordii]|uniref:PP2A regulatory subunit TAP46 n=1 Tax=Tripterygium wilfordii TaxID=458696 RepID=A0A7J7CE65_TRIWF|nr:PP2A regulatory subunit TAP46 [Tripterygium wilfordii]